MILTKHKQVDYSLMIDENTFEKNFLSVTEENMADVADQLKQSILSLGEFCVILLFGHMGSGKTTLIRLTLERMGVTETVNSPTFAIMNEYHLPHSQNTNLGKFFHYDFYRLNDPSELDELGVDEIWGKEGHTFIEWADKFPIAYPYPQIQVHFASQDPHSRNILIRTVSPKEQTKL